MSVTNKQDYIAFSNGINTETNFIKQEDGTCSELSNFKLNKDGSIEKRGGLLPSETIIKSSSKTNFKPKSYLWKNVAGVPDDNFYVVKQNKYLLFFKADINFSNTSKEPFLVNLGEHTSNGYVDGKNIDVKLIDGDGYLFASGKFIEPLLIKFDKKNKKMVVKNIDIKIRDYVGLDDGVKDITEYPTTFSNDLVYNLTNQGFSESDISQYYAENGCLPAKVDTPRNFKYTKISTSTSNPKKPVEIYDYQLSIESNFGTSIAPIGRRILDIFKRKRTLGSSTINISVNKDNLIGIKEVAGEAVLSFRMSRIPSVPINSAVVVDVEQSGFRPIFIKPDPAYTKTAFGSPLSLPKDTPVVVKWPHSISGNEDLQIFEGVDAPWSATPTITEAEYKSFSFRYNDVIMVRNTGLNNEYILISNSSHKKSFFKSNLAGDLGGTIDQEFLLPSNLNLSDDQKGTYIKITTNAKKDNLYYRRHTSISDFPKTYWYESKSLSAGGQEVITQIPAIMQGVNSILRPIKNKLTFKSENIAELTVGLRLLSIDDNYNTENPLPPGHSSYKFNYGGKNGRDMYGLDQILSQLKISYVVSTSPIDVSYNEEPYRPEAIAFYANRLFYSAYDSKTYSNHIFFSQMQNLEENIGKCYAKNDPTAEFKNALLDTDGGYIPIPEADNILNLVVVKDKLLVLARNSIYAIFGDPFFKATNYSLRKVADIGILSANAYTIVGETIVFASDDGVYNFNIDSLNGDLLSNNFSNEKIKTLYNSLTKDQRANIKLNYNPYEKKLLILLNKNTQLAPDFYDTILNYDFNLKAFYEYKIEQFGNLQIVDFFEEYSYNKSRPNSLLYYDNTTGDYGTLTEKDNVFKDFDLTNKSISCAVETNYINFNDVIRNKRVRRLHVYGDNTKDSYCEAFIKYDSSIISSNKWSKAESVFRLQGKTNGNVHMHQQVCRGDGLFFKLRFESNENKPCKILGWNLVVDGNQQI